jgi:hypothetical protein
MTMMGARREQRGGQRCQHARDSLPGRGELRQGRGRPCSTPAEAARVSVQNPWFVVVGRGPVQLVVDVSPSGCASPGRPGPILLHRPRHRLFWTEPWRLGEERVEEGGVYWGGCCRQDELRHRVVQSQAPSGRQVPQKWNRHS